MVAEFISFGTQCQVAHAIKLAGLRKASYPFDWIVTPAWSVLNCLQNDFKGFFELKRSQHPDTRFQSYENPYRMVFQHEAELGKEKLEIRIDRLRAVLNGEGPVIFVRKKVDEMEAVYLAEGVHSLYPKLRFSILTVNERRLNQNHPRLINREAQIPPYDNEVDPGSMNSWVGLLQEIRDAKTRIY